MFSPASERQRNPALDGLRGIALLCVLFFHSNGVLPGGYLGVEIFFVLSGYLISSLLLAEFERDGRISLVQFWVRRARRLLPALFVLMPLVAVYARFFAKQNELANLRADALATMAYVANWRTIFSGRSYWDLFAAPSPLEHTWSLAVEEQFYFVWPLLVLAFLRVRVSFFAAGEASRFWTPRKMVCVAASLLLTLSMVAMIKLYDPANTSRCYLGTDTRAAGILAGAVLATLLPIFQRAGRNLIRTFDGFGLLAALALAIAVWKLDGQNPFLYHGGLWLTDLATLALITCAAIGSRSIVARSLSLPLLVPIGKLSYGLYLWHWPINLVLTEERSHLSGARLLLLRFALTFLIAGLSYRFIEQPILKRGLPFGRPFYFVPAVTTLILLLIVRATYADPNVQKTPWEGAAMIQEKASTEANDAKTYELIFYGDSTANSLGWVMRGLNVPGVTVQLAGKDGCTMLTDMCASEWDEQAEQLHPDGVIVSLGGAFMHGISREGKWRKACDKGWDAKFEDTLRRRLTTLASRQHVWAATVPYPRGPWSGPQFQTEVACINRSLVKVASSVAGVEILDLADRLCPRGSCLTESEGNPIRPDGVHYSMEGAADLARWILESVRRRSTSG